MCKDVDPTIEIDNLPELGSKYKELPKGWTFETKVLTENLVLDTTKSDGWASIIRDEFTAPTKPAVMTRTPAPTTSCRGRMKKSAAQMISDAKAQVESLGAQDALAKVGEGGGVFVDVREGEESQRGHIDGAIPAPRGLLEFRADPTDPRHKDGMAPTRHIIGVCASGGRASLAAPTLRDMGYEDVAVLEGGFNASKDAGFPTVGHEHSGI